MAEAGAESGFVHGGDEAQQGGDVEAGAQVHRPEGFGREHADAGHQTEDRGDEADPGRGNAVQAVGDPEGEGSGQDHREAARLRPQGLLWKGSPVLTMVEPIREQTDDRQDEEDALHQGQHRRVEQ
ncbi:hypothetical protein CFIICLFH_3550 [Methylobacterium goesingense]|nr:hypothetical protein CFIICLFH_3550 [Methylobacterium goesingense]